MNNPTTSETVKRLLERKQSVPSQLIRALLYEHEAFKGMIATLKARITELEAKAEEAVTS